MRIPDELADEAEVVARVQGTSLNNLIVGAIGAEIDRVRSDNDFTTRAGRMSERDKELLERLGR